MTTTAPGLQTVKPRRVSTPRLDRHNPSLEKDPTRYPDSEVMCREIVENEICAQLLFTLRRYQAARGIVCFVGSDNFIYWIKGNNKASVSPDLYVLPGIPPTARVTQYVGSNDEQCWKTWIHQVVPNFAIEVKAQRNPRKDELQSPARHDALGTKELIVFDPFANRRRAHRKRFVVFRRDAAGKLVSVHETNDDRVYCEQLDAFLVAENEGDWSLLRLGVGPNGEKLVPFESELVELEARMRQEEARMRQEETLRADEQARMRQEEARMRQEESLRADEQARMWQEESLRADEQARMRQEESLRADEQARRADEAARLATEAMRRNTELEAEIARLRANADKRSQRRSKSEKSRVGR